MNSAPGSGKATEPAGFQPAPLALRGVTVVYRADRGDASDAALLDATVAFEEGVMTAIVGPNGAGKSTLLHAALGLVPMVTGEARFFGQPLAAVQRRVAFLPQRESIDWDFPITALEVVRMGATSGLGWWLPTWAAKALGRNREQERARAALAAVEMEPFANRPIGELSGGQQQRVFLARALAQDADLLLLDEPFAGVDAGTEGILLAELKRLVAQGRTVVAVHHDLAAVEEHFDRAVLVRQTIADHGPARALLSGSAARSAFGARGLPDERHAPDERETAGAGGGPAQ